jgi:hypothetical protein
MQLGKVLRPGAKAHALDAAINLNVDGSILRHYPSVVDVAGIGVAACIILIERLDTTLRILRAHD